MSGVDLMEGDGLPPQSTLTCFGYVLGRASAGRLRLSMLDWGGGLGQYGLIAHHLFPELEIEYHCHDLPLMVEGGRILLPHGHFHDDDAETFRGTYDLVMASSSLQYVKDWFATLSRLARCTRRYLYVTRQPVVMKADSFVVVQRPSGYGYDTEYAGWVLKRGDFLSAAAAAGMTMRREFTIDERPYIQAAPEQPVYRGFLFERTTND